MTFLNPAWLWSLLALLPLVAVYFLKVRPRRKPTNAFFLWEKVLAQKQSAALFRRLRDVISLLLLAAAAAAIGFALARPQLSETDSRDLLIVLDTSASMSAVDGSGSSRLEQGKARAVDLVKAMDGARRTAFATVDLGLDFATHLSDSPGDLLEAIDEVSGRTLPLSAAALRSLGAFATDGEEARHRIVFITDGVGQPTAVPEGVEVITVGEELEAGNVGIVAADLRWQPGQANAASLYVQLASSHKEDKPVEVELRSADGATIALLAQLTATPGVGDGRALEVPEIEAGAWELAIVQPDALEVDNVVSLGLNPLQPVPVRVEASDDYFYQRCVEAFALAGGQIAPGGDESAIAIAVGNAPSTGDAIVFAPSAAGAAAKSVGDEQIVALAVPVREGHPVIEHVDLVGIPFAGAREIELPDGAVVIAESSSGLPLIYKVQTAEQTLVVLNFNPAAGDFYLSPWFPVLVYDAALHLAGRGEQYASIYGVGSRLDFADETGVITPAGRQKSGLSEQLGELGIYKLEGHSADWLVGTGLLSVADSALQVREKREAPIGLASGSPLSVWLLVVAMLVLLGEWIMYHRRKAG